MLCVVVCVRVKRSGGDVGHGVGARVVVRDGGGEVVYLCGLELVHRAMYLRVTRCGKRLNEALQLWRRWGVRLDGAGLP